MRFYYYVYLDPNTVGSFTYGDLTFDHEPFYVGKGTGNRMRQHIYEAKNTKRNSPKLRRIRNILATDKEPLIQLSVLMSEDEAYAKEVEVISAIGRTNLKTGPLTNGTKGGDNPYQNLVLRLAIYQMSEGAILKEWPSITEAARTLSLGDTNISLCCLGKLHRVGGFDWTYADSELRDLHKQTKSDRADKFNGDREYYSAVLFKEDGSVTRFMSLSSASEITGIVYDRIAKNLRGQAVLREGNFYYEDAALALHYAAAKAAISEAASNRRVTCTTTGVTYASPEDACRQTGIKGDYISQCCKGLRKHTQGTVWAYADGNLQLQYAPAKDAKETNRHVEQYGTDGLFVRTHKTAIAGAIAIGKDKSSSIVKCCKGQQKQAHGYVWRYANAR